MIIAPILALIAYFAVDHVVGEQPHAAKEGASYPLTVKSNCRWPSGECTLENEQFELTLAEASNGNGLKVQSSVALEGIEYSMGRSGGSYSEVRRMNRVDAKTFELPLAGAAVAFVDYEIRLVAAASGASFYAATGLEFLAESDL